MNFKEMIQFFEDLGYPIIVQKEETYEFALHDKEDTLNLNSETPMYYTLRIGFCPKDNKQFYEYLNGKVAIDLDVCFNKWRDCPIILPFPSNEKEKIFLIEAIEKLRTPQGYEISNNYDFDNWIRSYPE